VEVAAAAVNASDVDVMDLIRRENAVCDVGEFW
jgi:hypothetical protein